MSDFKAKMHQIQCWGSAPDPAWGVYSTPPDTLAGFKGPTSKGREGKGGKGWGRGGGGMGGKEKEGRVGGRGKGKGGDRGEDVEGPGKWSAPGPVLALGGPAYVHRVHYYSRHFPVSSSSNDKRRKERVCPSSPLSSTSV